MPSHYGKKNGMKKSGMIKSNGKKGLTAKQKTLPPKLQKAILNKKKKK